MAKHSPENRPPGHETDLFLPEPESVLESTDGWHAEVTTGCMQQDWLQHSYKYLKSKTKGQQDRALASGLYRLIIGHL